MAEEQPPDPPQPVVPPQGPASPPPAHPIAIQDEMQTSYLDYAMSVIVGRAIPDVRDGLKPVHRRILYAMRDLGLGAGQPYRKCATVVGEVLGKYHPHGDASVYDALVRMAQLFSMRHPLVDGQGNFGSVDGDPPAAYRYTESRLTRIAQELLTDFDKDTVDYVPNFDDSREEPTVLPARFPNLLVNGSGGIAVGMATNIPPHNLAETLDASIRLIREPDVTIDELMEHVPGPDFPTGATIFGRAGIHAAYKTGRGSIIVRAKHEIEKVMGSADREQLVFTEIPYQVNKARLHAKIGELIRDKRLEGVREARDESDRDGMRFCVELKKDVYPQVVLNQLYRMTELQSSFGIINLAIVAGRPRVLDLKQTLQYFVEHRREVVTRRTRFELGQCEGRRELVEGLGMVTTDTDRVISTIRASMDTDEARSRLMELALAGLEEFVRRAGRPEGEIAEAQKRKDFRLSERQASAILEMRLARLTGLEREKLAAEYGELCDEIRRLTAILADEKLLFALIVGELEAVKAEYAEPRRTEIVEDEAEIMLEDLIQEEDMVVTISHQGYIKRTPVSVYQSQRRGGKGRSGMDARTDDFVSQLFIASTHSLVFFFDARGKLFVKKVYEIPQAARNAKGRAIVNFVGMAPGDRIAAITHAPGFDENLFLTTMTRRGRIKKTNVADYRNVHAGGIVGVKVADGDSLLAATVTDGKRHVLVATKSGQCIRFDESRVRAMGRSAAGVRAVDVDGDDAVVGFAVTELERTQVLAVCERGYGKRSELEEFRLTNRGGKGVILIDASDRNGPVVGIALVKNEDELMLVTDRGQTIRMPVEDIRVTGRNAQGVRLMRVDDEERVVALERIEKGDIDVEDAGASMFPPGGDDDALTGPSGPDDAGPIDGDGDDGDDGGDDDGSGGGHGGNGAGSNG